eukprot:7777418-Pyramimonas_sp.AAC.1
MLRPVSASICDQNSPTQESGQMCRAMISAALSSTISQIGDVIFACSIGVPAPPYKCRSVRGVSKVVRLRHWWSARSYS